jgi:ABC-type transport system involved in cytochrome c biogenesis permease subunit
MRATRIPLGLTLGWFMIAATLAAHAKSGAAAGGETATKRVDLGTGPAYRALGEIPVLHKGRIKPLDTFARLEVKELYGREEIKLVDSKGDVREKWSALGALVDWPVRPSYWDEQEVLLIDLWDYRATKQLLLASAIKEDLKAIAASANTSGSDRAALEALGEQETISEKDLARVLKEKKATLAADARATLTKWAEKLGEGRKWISPADLERAQLDDGQHTHEFLDYFGELYDRAQAAREGGRSVKFTPREQRVITLGERLLKYQAFRDRNERAIPEFDIGIVPRPSSPAYLTYTGKVVERLVSGKAHAEDPNPLDRDVFDTLRAHLTDIKSVTKFLLGVRDGEQKPPGSDPKFDRTYAKWLRESAGWVPLRLVLTGDLDEFTEAGFPADRIKEFRTAHAAFEDAEKAAPGRAEAAGAQKLLLAARALGGANNPTRYPPTTAMSRETHFNAFAPFVKAPFAYGLSLVLLLISLGIHARPGTTMAKVDRGLYLAGLLAFVTGIGLEIYGFYLRILISGWAPVTNMYETVIWVAFGAAILGLVLELIFRRKFAATAAAGVAMLATILAASVPLLDANIGALTPVLRDNYWLTVHVLTIVSSYAAFTLALGLGLLGLCYYLSATYRADGNYRSLGLPVLWGIPLFALGAAAYMAIPQPSALAVALGLVGAFGAYQTFVGLFAMLGEYANRRARESLVLGIVACVAGAAGAYWLHDRTAPAWWPTELPMDFIPGAIALSGFGLVVMSCLGGRSRKFILSASPANAQETMADEIDYEPAALGAGISSSYTSAQGNGGTAVATKARPSVGEILSKAGRKPPSKDPRDPAIQFTASQVKPLSNFIYRAMQVGVLLVAAGTILGGVWADVSWGRFWGWDPKEVWALITLLVYLIPLHGRFAGWVSTFGIVGASVVCYMSVLMAWYGVNFVLGVGLHTYGFTAGGGQGVVLASVMIILGIVGAAARRRRLTTRAALG